MALFEIIVIRRSAHIAIGRVVFEWCIKYRSGIWGDRDRFSATRKMCAQLKRSKHVL